MTTRTPIEGGRYATRSRNPSGRPRPSLSFLFKREQIEATIRTVMPSPVEKIRWRPYDAPGQYLCMVYLAARNPVGDQLYASHVFHVVDPIEYLNHQAESLGHVARGLLENCAGCPNCSPGH